MRKFIVFLVLVTAVSCASNLTKNFVKTGSFDLVGGKFQNTKWNSELSFNRYTWFHEVTMLYDLILTKIDSKSPFYDWFANSEKRTMGDCSDFYLVVDYSLDSKKVSKKMLENDAKRAGYEKVAMEGFKSHLKLHPDVEELSLQLYDVYGLCYKGEISSKERIMVRFPGFQEVVIQ